MKRNWLPYIEISMAMVIVGSNIVAGKMVIAGFPVFLFSTLRFVISSGILLVLLLRSGAGFPRVERRDTLRLLLQAFTGSFLYSVFLLSGLQLTSAATSGIISGTVPAMVGIISYLVLREQLTRTRSAGIVLVVIGMIVINSVGVAVDAQQGANPLLGNLLIIGSVIGEAMWIVLSKGASRKIATITSTTIISCFGLFLFLPFGTYQAFTFDFASVSLVDWCIVLYYGTVGTVAAYLLWYHGVAKVSASTAGVFTGIFPISVLVLSYVILGEPLTWAHAIGVLCVLLAIVLIAREAS